MASLAEYFAKLRYKPKYFLGDRVRGKLNKIPFTGTVANDSLVSEEEGAKISIFLDLPIVVKKQVMHIITVKHKAVTLLIGAENESSNLHKNSGKRGNSRSSKVGKQDRQRVHNPKPELRTSSKG